MNVSKRKKRKVRYSHFECRHDEDVDDDEKRDRIGFERIEKKKKSIDLYMQTITHLSWVLLLIIARLTQ